MLSDEIKHNVMTLINLLKSLPNDQFNINHLILESNKSQGANVCGTPACIAGWSYWLANGKPEMIYLHKPILEEAAVYLGVPYTVNETNYMFDKIFNNCHDYDDKTKQEAINMLQHYHDTGEVTWGEE